jgi:hypothetical protein
VLALGCGLRWGEITSLTWENVSAGGVRILAGLAKGRRQRVVPISKGLSRLLQAGRSGKEGKVITGDVGEVHEKVCRWLRRKGVKDPKPIHYLRKCYRSLAVADHGIFVASVAGPLEHKSDRKHLCRAGGSVAGPVEVIVDLMERPGMSGNITELTAIPMESEVGDAPAGVDVLDLEFAQLLAAEPVEGKGGKDRPVAFAFQSVRRQCFEKSPSLSIPPPADAAC